MKIRKVRILPLALALAGCGLLDPTPGPAPYSPSGNAPPAGSIPVGQVPGGAGAPGGGTGQTGDPLVAEGEALYMQSCAICHAADGTGTGLYEESIQGFTGMAQVVRDGRGTMPAFPQYNDRDVSAMEAYLASVLQPGGGGPRSPPVPQGPREVYAVACASCHGADGEGNAKGPQLRNPVAPYATWVTRNGRSGVGFPDPMPAYGTDVLPAATLDGIIDWLAEAPVPSDGRQLYLRFCGNCHGADARGGPTRQSIVDEDLEEWIETTRDGEGGRDYGSRGDYMPAWSRLEISDAQLRAMFQAIRGGGGRTPPEEQDD